jgi:hypothetical protein
LRGAAARRTLRAMDWLVLAVFAVVYAGMFLGRLPGLALDRTGIALLGANLIVVDQAGRLGIDIGWREHARVGVPVTLVTLAVAAFWLWLR